MEPRDYHRVRVEFVQLELVLARTFCRLARSKANPGRSSCVRYARKAYNSAARFMLKAGMDNTEFAAFSADLEEVQLAVEALESQLPRGS